MDVLQKIPDARERRRPWRVLLRKLWPADQRFYPLLDAHAALCVEGLSALLQLLADLSDSKGHGREIEALEKRADGVVDEVRSLLRRTLFPPFTRAALYELINHLDDVLDLTEDAAQSIHLYHVTEVTPEAVRLAELALQSAKKLQTALQQLATLNEPRLILTLCTEVDQLEAQADHVMRAAMSRLFREEPDSHQLVKLKAVYELLESLTDCCKDVSNDIESLVLRYA